MFKVVSFKFLSSLAYVDTQWSLCNNTSHTCSFPTLFLWPQPLQEMFCLCKYSPRPKFYWNFITVSLITSQKARSLSFKDWGSSTASHTSIQSATPLTLLIGDTELHLPAIVTHTILVTKEVSASFFEPTADCSQDYSETTHYNICSAFIDLQSSSYF